MEPLFYPSFVRLLSEFGPCFVRVWSVFGPCLIPVSPKQGYTECFGLPDPEAFEVSGDVDYLQLNAQLL